MAINLAGVQDAPAGALVRASNGTGVLLTDFFVRKGRKERKGIKKLAQDGGGVVSLKKYLFLPLSFASFASFADKVFSQ